MYFGNLHGIWTDTWFHSQHGLHKGSESMRDLPQSRFRDTTDLESGPMQRSYSNYHVCRSPKIYNKGVECRERERERGKGREGGEREREGWRKVCTTEQFESEKNTHTHRVKESDRVTVTRKCAVHFYFESQADAKAQPSKKSIRTHIYTKPGEAHSPGGHLDLWPLRLHSYRATCAKCLWFSVGLNDIHAQV